jgi:hypothetical protein
MISYKQSPHSESISCTLRPQLHYIEALLFIAVQVSQNIKTPPGELESQNIKTPPGELELDNTIEKKFFPKDMNLGFATKFSINQVLETSFSIDTQLPPFPCGGMALHPDQIPSEVGCHS